MYETQKEKLAQAVDYLNELNIDAWVIYTSEGSDPCIPLVTGVGTVGPGAFIITKKGEKIAICSSIDAQDIEESGLFDDVLHYTGDMAQVFAKTIQKIAPKKIALNMSKEEHLADGLTTGRYRWLEKALAPVFDGEYVSSEPFLSLLRSIKSSAEIEKIKKAVDITTEIYDIVFEQMSAGMTEKEVGQLFVNELEKRGLVNGVDRKIGRA